MTNRRVLSVFSLVMINVIAVDNLRSLAISAEYGFSLVFYYLACALIFFIPSALVSAELATGWPQTGGVYVWVREAFGKRAAFLTIWLQWIYNVVWYPTALAFIGGLLAYLIDPSLVNNKVFMLCIIISFFWIATLINVFGMRISSLMSSISAIAGTIIPMLFIIILGAFWIFKKNIIQIDFTIHSFLPDLSNWHSLAYLTAILFSLMGMEMSAVHAEEVKNPQRDYPKALLYSTIIILCSLTLASLAIAMVVPQTKISLVSGLINAFSIFFHAYHLTWIIPIISFAMLIGSLGGISAWIIGPTKGLLIASYDGTIPPMFHRTNQRDVPVALLITQAIIVTILSTIFLLMPTVNTSYWLLSALTSQLALLFYIFLFAAAIKLRYSKPDQPRAYKIPGGKLGIWLVCGISILTCIVVAVFGFFPASNITTGNILFYEGFLLGGILVFCGVPFLIYYFHNPSWINES